MRDFEYLPRTLPKFIDLTLHTHLFDRIYNLLKVNHSFICHIVKKVVGFNSILSPLLRPKNEINPQVQMIGHIIRLQSLPHRFQKQHGVVFGPFGELHIMDLLLILPRSQIQVHGVEQERRVILVELRDELFEACGVLHHVLPVTLYAFKEAVGFVEFAALQLQHVFGFHTYEVSDDVAGCRVVASVQELWWRHVLVTVEEPF